jgi:hypothetical protein
VRPAQHDARERVADHARGEIERMRARLASGENFDARDDALRERRRCALREQPSREVAHGGSMEGRGRFEGLTRVHP